MQNLTYDIAGQPPTLEAILHARGRYTRAVTALEILFLLGLLADAVAAVMIGGWSPWMLLAVVPVFLADIFSNDAHLWLHSSSFAQMRFAIDATHEGRCYYLRVLKQGREFTRGEFTAMQDWPRLRANTLTAEHARDMLYSPDIVAKRERRREQPSTSGAQTD